jgi:aspartate racemase
MNQQQVIGIIGGIAPPSTIDYYQKIVTGFQSMAQTNHYPSILINSIDMTKMLALVSEKKFDELVDYLSNEIEKLHRGGADFAVLSSNTPHIVFDELQKQSAIPLISIVQSCVEYAESRGFKKLGLFGTKSTMQNGFYQSGFLRCKIQVATPSPELQDYIHEKYMGELVKGVFLDETKNKFVGIANDMKRQDGIEGLILGGTELPFILQEKDFAALPLLNTTEIHVARILEQAMKNKRI